jgi:hypothetical protein
MAWGTLPLKLNDVHIARRVRRKSLKCVADPRCKVWKRILVLSSLQYEVFGSLPAQARTVLILAGSGFTTALT